MPTLDEMRALLRAGQLQALTCEKSSLDAEGKPTIAGIEVVGDTLTAEHGLREPDWGSIAAAARTRSKKFSISSDGVNALIFFGKYNGRTIRELVNGSVEERGYVTWILTQEFDEKLKDICRLQLKRYRAGVRS
jgi:hypothetical protein